MNKIKLSEHEVVDISMPYTDTDRFEWFFGPDNKGQGEFIEQFLLGVQQQWSVDQWRRAIDTAMANARIAKELS